MENIFNQKPADRLVDAANLLEIVKMAVSDDSGSGRDLCRQRTAGLCLLCNIIQQLIADENN